LRISDLLSIQVKHVFTEWGTVKEDFTLTEAKTKKKHKVKLPEKAQSALELYKKTYPSIIIDPDHYIFFRAKSNDKWLHHISRIQGWKYIKQWCAMVWLVGSYGWHSLRKTWGYHARQKGVPINLIQHKLNHSSQAVTLRYIGITQQEVDDIVDDLNL
jgi:integrase